MNLPRDFSWEHGIGDFRFASVSCLRLYEARIYLVLALRTYPGTTIARDHLASSVIPLVTY